MRLGRDAILLNHGCMLPALKKRAGSLTSRSIMASVMLVIILVDRSTASADPLDLYAATVIVTGRDNLAERTRGIREALPLVLTKLTADSTVGQRAIEQGLQDEAETLVSNLEYRDRKEGIQISDEQGTRDRSFELRVHFDVPATDELVAQLGGQVWRGERPVIAVGLVVDDGVNRFLLTETSEKGYGQRLALTDAARTLALPVVLPKAVGDGNSVEAEQAAALSSSRVSLAGNMAITSAGYWNTHWRLEAPEAVAEIFATSDTTFDVAIEEALRHSARALAKR